MLGPSPGGDLAGKQETNARDIPTTAVPRARSSSACLSARSPSPPRRRGAKTRSSPSTERDVSCSGAYLHGQAASRKPNTLAPLLGGCQPRVHLCVSQTRRGQSLSLWAWHTGFGRRRSGVAACPCEQHRPKINIFDLISLLHHTNPHGHILAVHPAIPALWILMVPWGKPLGDTLWGVVGLVVWQRQHCHPMSAASPCPVSPRSPPRKLSRRCQQWPWSADQAQNATAVSQGGSGVPGGQGGPRRYPHLGHVQSSKHPPSIKPLADAPCTWLRSCVRALKGEKMTQPTLCPSSPADELHNPLHKGPTA